MNPRLEVDGKPISFDSGEELMALLTKVFASGFTEIAMIIPNPQQAKRWEKIIYPMLGLVVPTSETTLNCHNLNTRFMLIFEEDEKEWTSSNSEQISNAVVKGFTLQGEEFLASEAACVNEKEALEAFQTFHETRKRPLNVKWKTNRKQ
jgi:hypothetical protein